MRDGRLFVLVLAGVIACGGGGKKDTNEPVDNDTGGGDGGGGGDVMVPPEKMDEINVRLDRKRGAAARCLSDAVLAGEAPKNARGKITLEFVISMAGKAQGIKVVKATFENQVVTECVIGKIRDVAFPDLPKPLDWSYTFSFESM